MQLNYLEINGNPEEVICHGSSVSPMEVYPNNLDLRPNRMISWHWYRELKFVYVLTGTIEFQTGAQIYTISEGQGDLLPSNMLHMANPYRRQRGSTCCAVLADPHLLHGLFGDAVGTRYVSSLTGSGGDSFLFDNNCSWHGKILDFIREIYICDVNCSAGYLQKLQILVQQSGLTLFEHLDKYLDTNQGSHGLCEDIRCQGVRVCLEYIHQEHIGKVRLEDTADAACVSVSKCCRDFRQVLGQALVDYLISYCVHMGEYPLAHSDKSVLETALAVGFFGSSHFSNTFFRYRGRTPLNYRKRGKK